MDGKDRLIEMIQSATSGCARYWASLIADKLLAEGVIVPPSNVAKLIAENEKLRERQASYDKQIRADARREFAEKLKNYYIKNFNSLKGSINCDLVAYHIDQILADMERKEEQ